MAALQDEGFQAVCATLQRLARQELANAKHDLGGYGQNFHMQSRSWLSLLLKKCPN